MDFREIEYIIVIAQEKNLSKAAERLYISQPALGRYLLRLEDKLGTQLFERKNRRYIPTYAGEMYLEMAHKILELHQGFNSDLERYRRSETGTLSIGMTPGRSRSTLPHILPNFRDSFPDYDLRVYEEDVDTLEELLMSEKIQMAFFTVAGNARHPTKGIQTELISREEIVFVTSAEERFSLLASEEPGRKFPVIPLQAFEQEPFLLLKENMRLGKYGHELLKKYGIVPRTMELGSIDTILALVAEGYGVAFASSFRIAYHASAEKLNIFSFGKEPECWEFVVAYQEELKMTNPVKYFLKLIREMYQG